MVFSDEPIVPGSLLQGNVNLQRITTPNAMTCHDDICFITKYKIKKQSVISGF